MLIIKHKIVLAFMTYIEKMDCKLMQAFLCSYIFPLLFLVPPEISVTNHVLGAPKNSRLILECVVEAYPPPIIYWTNQNGTVLFI